MAKGICIVSSVMMPLFCALFKEVAALPASPLWTKATMPELPSRTSTIIDSDATKSPEPYQYQNVILRTSFFGQAIPEIELKSTLFGARLIVNKVQDHRVDEALPNNRFEYQCPGSNMLIAIDAQAHEQITWWGFSQVLRALQGFMTAIRPCKKPRLEPSKVHSLNGTLHFPRIQDGAPIVSGPERRLTAWPVPGTDIEFIFTIFGNPIVPRDLFNLLRATQAEIAAAVRTKTLYRIRNNHFHYINHEHSLAIYIVAYDNEAMTWSELGLILNGLSLFCSEGHSRGLVFEINVFDHMIGFGMLQPFSDSRGATTVIKRAFVPTLPLPSSTIASACVVYPVPGTPMTLYISPFGQTDISLAETSAALTGALREIYPHLARERGQAIPDNEWSYGDGMTDVWLSVLVWSGRTLSWQQLSWVVFGLLQWMTGPGRSNFKTVLVDFNVQGEGFLGIGALRTQGLPTENAKRTAKVMANEIAKSCASDVERRSTTTNKTVPLPYRKAMASVSQGKDETLLLPWPIPLEQSGLKNASSASSIPTKVITLHPTKTTTFGDRLDPFRIPNTPIILYFNTLPTPIPAARVAELWTGAQHAIEVHVQIQPDDPISPASFSYHLEYSGNREIISFFMHPEPNHQLTWLQLRQIMLGVQIVMTGRGTASHMLALEITVGIGGLGIVANGLVRYIKIQ
ncbi:hypothetical protein N7G274_010347 [Stereocaulon virgatum]|uniref:Uncharacterized protein n=1 Tax=Stereocaulon virgatum TaxID=373712 RepID=A0ABR3ZTR8_9LECA